MKPKANLPYPDRKISETFLEFAAPVLNELPAGFSKSDIELALRIVFVAWNAVVLAEVRGDKQYLDQIRSATSSNPQSAYLLEQLIDRKKTVFADDHRIIGKYEVKITSDGFNLWAEARSPYPQADPDIGIEESRKRSR